MNETLSRRIDVIKITASMMVYCLHAYAIIDGAHPMLKRIPFGLLPSAWGGVWVFTVLAGFFSGLSFASKRYDVTFTGVLRFYRARISRILIPSVVFVVLIYSFSNVAGISEMLRIIKDVVMCRYKGEYGLPSVQHLWFVSMIMLLYYLTPIMCLLMNLLSRKDWRCEKILLALLLIFGLLFRLYAYRNHLSWSVGVYTRWYYNLDLFMCGLIEAYILYNSDVNTAFQNRNRWMPFLGFSSFFLCVGMSSFSMKKALLGSTRADIINRYFFPTIFLLVIILFFASNYCAMETNTQLHKVNRKTIVSSFFDFYMFHPIMLFLIGGHILPTELSYVIWIIVICILTLLIACIYHIIIEKSLKVVSLGVERIGRIF